MQISYNQLFQRPLSLGADISLHSVTKYINGHTDVIMGAAITNRKDIDEHLLFQQIGKFTKSKKNLYRTKTGCTSTYFRFMDEKIRRKLLVSRLPRGKPAINILCHS